MKEQLDKKITYFEGVLLTRFQQLSGVDITAQGARDIRAFLVLSEYLKTWIEDHQKLKTRWSEPLENIVVSYFTDEPAVFSLLLADKIAKKISAAAPNKVNEFINEIGSAIAYEQVKITAISCLVDLSTNS